MAIIEGTTPLPLCRVEGCGNKVTRKGRYKGHPEYRTVCSVHHRSLQSPGHRWSGVRGTCTACGLWAGSLDKHRKVAGGSYDLSNVEFLCPNCHREAHGLGAYIKPTLPP